MPQPRVLISGASVAGPALAYWLVRAGCRVTIVERAASLRSEGQGIDVRDSARDVIKRMGIFDTMRDKSSQEEGLQIVNGSNRVIARFAADLTSGKGDSISCDIEILRGELAKILYDITKDDVSYIFDDMVDSLEETDEEVAVTFANGTPKAGFDLVVAADGIGSRIRGMAFGKDSCRVRSLNGYVAYFSIPPTNADTLWSKVHWFKGGRVLFMRPDNVGRTRCFLCVTAYDSTDERLPRLEKASKESASSQKLVMQELFRDADWEVPRVLNGMDESSDWYLQHVVQIQLDRWSSGRVTVVGDAGYAPSPFTGMGTSIAFIGAYILAGEISKQPNNIPAALASYERVLRPYVESIQKLPPGIPWIVNPQSRLGVRVLETLAWVAGVLSTTWLASLFSKLFFTIAEYLPFGEESFQLPEYEAFRQ